MDDKFRLLRIVLPCALSIASLSACGEGAAPAANDAAAETGVLAKDGSIDLTAENIDRLGLKFAKVTAATDAPIAVVPAIIAPPPNARVAVAATFPGVVTRVLAVEGQEVRRGQALAVISSRDILTMGADLSRASARLGYAQSNAGRLSQLEREGVIAGARADEARAVLGEARADVSEKSRILGMVNGSGASGTYTLVAPIAGKITLASAQAGSVVDGASAPFVIDAAGKYEAEAQLPERFAGQVRSGMTVKLGQDVQGTVTSVGSTVDPATRSVKLKASLPAGPVVMSGRTANLSIYGPASAGAVMAPQTAVVDLPGGPAVFVRTGKGVMVRPVQTGGKDGENILILSGLTAADQVVVAGVSTLKSIATSE